MSAAERGRKVNCPRCGIAAPWSAANPYRPFCSERCKLIDLGQWASEGYRVPVAEDQENPAGEGGDREA